MECVALGALRLWDICSFPSPSLLLCHDPCELVRLKNQLEPPTFSGEPIGWASGRVF